MPTRAKRPAWARTQIDSLIVLCNFPQVLVRVSKQPKGCWSWRVRVSNGDVRMGEAPSRLAAETAGLASVWELAKELEWACRKGGA